MTPAIIVAAYALYLIGSMYVVHVAMKRKHGKGFLWFLALGYVLIRESILHPSVTTYVDMETLKVVRREARP